MAGKMLTTDYSYNVRDLSGAFEQIVKQSPVLSELIRISSKRAINTKHEWGEDVVTPLQWTLNAGYTAAAGSMTLVSTTGLLVNDILQFEKTTGARSTLLAKVTAVTNATTIAISVYWGSTDENLLSGAIITLVSRPQLEATSPNPTAGYEPTSEYNYTQIFDRTAKVSKTQQAVDNYLISDAMDYQVERKLFELTYEWANTLYNQARVQRTASEPGTMWGIMRFLKNAAGNSVDAASSAISQTIMNNAFELFHNNGGMNVSLIVCHPVQARKISAFNTTGNNPQVRREDTTTGSYVTTYVSDQGDIVQILADRNFDKDKIALLDMTRIQVVPLRPFQDSNAANNGDDFEARRILGEYTLEVRNAANCHTYIYGLTV